ncbi:MAG: hypothetical protein AB7L09_21250 [Nitrospira sp.]
MSLKFLGCYMLALMLSIGILPVETAPVLAQATVSTEIDVSPITTELIKILAAALSAVAIWIGWYIKDWVGKKVDLTNTQLDEALQQQYNEIVLRGIAYAETVAGDKLPKTVDAGNPFVKTAGDYILKFWPDLVKKLNLTPEKVRETILSRLPSPTAEKADELAVAKASGTPPPAAS